MERDDGLVLRGGAFEAAFPFFLHLDGQERLLRAGASLLKALPGLKPGEPVEPWLERRRPRAPDWSRHAGELCVLRARGGRALILRGAIQPQADGSVLLLCSGIVPGMDEIRALGLSLDDFALHDPMGDMLLIHQSLQMSLDDAQRNARRVRERTDELETVLALSADGIGYFSPDGLLRLANGALAAALGCDKPALQGQSLEDFAQLCRARLDPQEPRIVSAELLRAQPCPLQDQTLRFASGRMQRFDLRRSAGGGLMISLVDVTREHEVERLKSEFLTTAAHELRTPMVSVFGYVELLMARRYEPAQQQQMLQTVHRHSQRLVAMVDELLDLARIDARSGLDLELGACDVDLLLEAAVGAADAHGDPRRICRPPLPAGLGVQADLRKTLQALDHVLSNAFKYSPAGGEIVLDAVCLPRADGRGGVGLRVSDRGIGMNAEQQARVFERFYRADPSGNIPGTGLGLAFVQELIGMQGGHVELSSAPGEGTQVTLWLPEAA